MYSEALETNRYLFTRAHMDESATPPRVAIGRWRPPDIDLTTVQQHVVSQPEVGCLDAVAYNYYGIEELWPIIAFYSNIRNPFTDMYPGQVLVIPSLAAIKACQDTFH